MKHALAFFSLIVLTASTALAVPISFDYIKVGSYHSQGLMDLFGLGTWNGKPLTDDNKPSDDNRLLAVTTNFYVSRSVPNQLFIQLTDVITTQNVSLFGSAMDSAALTGIRFWLPAKGLTDLGTPTFSSDYANPGEVLFPGTGNGTTTVPLTTTPGYELDRLASAGAYSIHTQDGSEYAFGTWGWVTGTERIMGGGVFDLTFAPSVDLLRGVDYRDAQLDAIYGSGLQYIRADWVGAGHEGPTTVPEPSTMLMVGGAVVVAAYRRRLRS